MEEKDIIYYGKIAKDKVKNLFKKNKKSVTPQPDPAPEQKAQPKPEPTPASLQEPGSTTQSQASPEAAQITEPQPQSAPVSESQPKPQDPAFDYVNFLENIRPKILRKIEEKFQRITYSDYFLLIDITDSEAYQAAKENDLGKAINIYIDSMRGKRFKEVKIQSGALMPIGTEVTVTDNVTVAVTNAVQQPKQVQKTASISILDEANCICTLGEAVVVLDPNEQTVWNIGWGKNTNINNRPRINHIALDYKHPDENDTNVYMISRAHAHIKFVEGNFYFYVEERGTRQAMKSTKLISGNETKPLTNINVGHKLKDGDVIQLNAESLIFNYK